MTKEEHIILPPPTAVNPFPALNAALRVDEQEQLFELLQQDPISSHNPRFRQLLVFGSPRLRTLLLRQALTDPHERVWKGAGKKKNWDAALEFPFPPNLTTTILGTKVLVTTDGTHETASSSPLGNSSASNITKPDLLASPSYDDQGINDAANWSDAVQWANDGNLDVVTYFLHAHSLEQVKAVIHIIKTLFLTKSSNNRAASASRNTVHHRLVFLPQQTEMLQQLLQQAFGAVNPSISFTSLALDLFPLETDVFSTEYHGGLRDAVAVEMTPSHFISSTARSLLKLQDITGTIPRIQAYGPLAEEGKDFAAHSHLVLVLSSTSLTSIVPLLFQFSGSSCTRVWMNISCRIRTQHPTILMQMMGQNKKMGIRYRFQSRESPL